MKRKRDALQLIRTPAQYRFRRAKVYTVQMIRSSCTGCAASVSLCNVRTGTVQYTVNYYVSCIIQPCLQYRTLIYYLCHMTTWPWCWPRANEWLCPMLFMSALDAVTPYSRALLRLHRSTF